MKKILSVLSVAILFFTFASNLFADNEPLPSQVAKILADESGKGKIKAGFLDFSLSTITTEIAPTDAQMKAISIQMSEDFMSELLKSIKESGNRDKIAIIERSRLDQILQEKKLQVTGITENTATEIGGIAGLDVIILGSVNINGDNSNMMAVARAKVVRVKDGEVLGIAKEEKQIKSTPTPAVLIDEVVNLSANSAKKVPLHIAKESMITLTVNVVHGNPVDVYVIPTSELGNFNNALSITGNIMADPAARERAKHMFQQVEEFRVTKARTYKRAGVFRPGDCFIILVDTSKGVLSLPRSDIKVHAQLN